MLSFANRRSRYPFQYEAVNWADYAEPEAAKGAKIENTNVANPDIVRIFTTVRSMKLEESIDWIEKHSPEFSPSTVIIDTDDGNSLSQYRNRKPEVFISKRPLNTIWKLNTFLNRANETLEEGGYIWCHCLTAVLKKKLILKRFPAGINWIVYLLHYTWHRVMPKFSRFTKRIYFDLTKGKDRTYNRVEVLGRMYRAGFEVVNEEFRFGEFFVLARKIKPPLWDNRLVGAPLIRLKRIGKDGRIIGVYKFRTMYSYSEYLQPYVYLYNQLQKGGKFADDYRINGWGKILRATWLDELPMLINFFRGEMKLVGVRPLSQHYLSLYTPEMQALHVKVKPGLLPPFYYEKQSPVTLEEIQASEKRYIEAYLVSPFGTDWRYFWGIVGNILLRGKRSK